MIAKESQSVSFRRVFYIPGFDPHPPRRYRELYRTEAAKQAQISDYKITQEKPRSDSADWVVHGAIEDRETYAALKVLPWADIAREQLKSGLWTSWKALAQMAYTYLGTGTFRRLSWLRKGPVLAGLYPVAMLLAQALLALVAAMIAGSIFGALLWSGAGWIVGLPIFVAVLRWFERRDGKFFAHYLIRDYAYTASQNGAYPEELSARLKAFEEEIAKALTTDADEVLVVGHSSGAHLAVSVVADLIRAGRVPANGPELSLLTLGQAIPMVSFLPDATRLRGDLQYLSTRDEMVWIDVSAPSDGCCFALCDPVAVTGVSVEDSHWPLVLSAAFTKTLTEESLADMRWRYFRRHFQYICAFDTPGDYDYFKITAGPQTLGQRFAHRKPSVSRIDVPASRYTTVAA
ncbi:MAG: hypothetical protein HRU32_15120 [Rhodobacteraceae bacterium]|nr:hypothetical protein [Paracoccaceae bacterium]